MTQTATFYKMSGSGNDFILIDNRAGIIQPEVAADVARRLCQRKLSVGADGLILIETDHEVDFCWQFFNADGSSAEMCGNGGRCVARLANLLGICGPSLAFRTRAGILRAEVLGSRVKLQMPVPEDLRLDEILELDTRTVTAHFVNTGVPHVVLVLNSETDLEEVEVQNQGRKIRYHSHYGPAGTNVNFVAVTGSRTLANRTYERGVENETLACGTGATAAALVAAAKGLVDAPVVVYTRSGEILTVYFNSGQPLPEEVYMEGEATVVYQGQLWQEALDTSA
ncbi:MAG: diaminopimelate epimerase [Deltaproteobacteria bacterium]|nr:MAG: diaminopimelate epimerase [Deltaproteobacteria bacterium]